MTDTTEAFWTEYFPTAFAKGDRFIPGHREVLLPHALSASEIRKWVSQVCRSLGVTPTEFAKRAGLAPSTINRFLKEEGPGNLSARTLEALTRAHSDAFVEKAMEYRSGVDRTRHSANFETIARIDGLQSTYFEWDEMCDYKISSPVPRSMIYGIYFGFEIGKSAGYTKYREGDVVFGVPLCPFLDSLQGGREILVHERQDDGYVDAHIRKLVSAPDGNLWLVRYSDLDISKALFFGDLNRKGFNEKWLASFLLIGSIHCAEWTEWG